MKKFILIIVLLLLIGSSCTSTPNIKEYNQCQNNEYFKMYRAIHDLNLIMQLDAYNAGYNEDDAIDNSLDEFSIFCIKELRARLNITEDEARNQFNNALLVWANSSEKKYNGEENPIKLFKENIISNISNIKVQEIFEYYGIDQKNQNEAWEFYTQLYFAYEDITHAYIMNNNDEYPELENIDIEDENAYSDYCKKQVKYWSNFNEFEKEYINSLKNKIKERASRSFL